jgi:hypothetical protein
LLLGLPCPTGAHEVHGCLPPNRFRRWVLRPRSCEVADHCAVIQSADYVLVGCCVVS